MNQQQQKRWNAFAVEAQRSHLEDIGGATLIALAGEQDDGLPWSITNMSWQALADMELPA